MLDVWNDRQRPKLPNPDAPVVCWQYRWEFERLLMLYCDRAPTSVLELGSYMGGTLFFWLSHGVSGACAVSVDVYCKPEDYPGDVPEDYDRRYLYESWCAPGVSVVAIKGSTADRSVQEQVQALGPYDWMFIDADHSYEAVKADFWTYLEMATRPGIISLHDIMNHRGTKDEGVPRLWQEIQGLGFVTQEFICDYPSQAGEGCGIGVVYL